MQIVLVLAVVAALVISESSPAEPVSGVTARLVAAGVGMAMVTLFAAVSSGLISRRIRGDFRRAPLLLPTYRRLRRVHVVLWLAVAGGTAYWLDWAQLVRFNWQLDRAFLVDDLLILLPVLLPLVLSWAAFYEVDRALLAGGAGETSEFASRRQYLALHARHYLGLLLLPVLTLLAMHDAAELTMPGLLRSDYALLAFVPPMVLLFGLFPVLLRYVWQTRPLEPGPLRNRLEAAAARHGFRMREILVWQTNSMVVNAAVAGFLPRLRYVFLTDGLLEWLTDEEIEAVFGHELGHVRHHHLLLRVAAMFGPIEPLADGGPNVSPGRELAEQPPRKWGHWSAGPGRAIGVGGDGGLCADGFRHVLASTRVAGRSVRLPRGGRPVFGGDLHFGAGKTG